MLSRRSKTLGAVFLIYLWIAPAKADCEPDLMTRYFAVKILYRYIANDKGNLKAHYITDEAERSLYEIHVRNKKLVWSDNTLVSTLHHCDIVMGPDGRIFADRLTATRKDSGLEWYHSTFLAGGPVAMAGTFMAIDGVILELTPATGHYALLDASMAQLTQELRRRGANLDRMKYYNRSGFVVSETDLNQNLKDFLYANFEHYVHVQNIIRSYDLECLSLQDQNNINFEIIQRLKAGELQSEIEKYLKSKCN